MDIKKHVQESLEKRLHAARKEERKVANAIISSRTIDPDHALYSVTVCHVLNPTKYTATVHMTGTLKEAVESAEKRYHKQVGFLFTPDAHYNVNIYIGDFKLPLPESAWRKYTQAHKIGIAVTKAIDDIGKTIQRELDRHRAEDDG